MDINSMRNFYKSIFTIYISDFNIKNPSTIKINENILSILFNKFKYTFTQIDSNLFMYIENNNYHIIKVDNVNNVNNVNDANYDLSFNYTIFTRIERHDDSCTYVRIK